MRNRPRPAASRRLAAAAALLILACQPPPERAAPLPVQHHPYTPAAPERALHFPADHGPHREAAIEWWYFTGHVLTPAATDSAGRSASPAGGVPVPSAAALEQAGFEVTVFRISPPAGPLAAAPAAGRPAQASFLSLHVAVTDLAGRTFRHKTLGLRERLGVAWVAGSPERPLDLRLPGATITLAADGSFRVEADLTDEQGAPLRVHATLGSAKPVTLHGAGGYSRKGSCASCASHYSSFPRLRGPASVSSAGGERRGTAVAWFDHEFSSGALGGGLRGWDWLALQLDDGWELMAAQTRSASGEPAGRAATLIAPGGEVTALAEGELTLTPSGAWLSPHSGATYPARWRVQVRSRVHPLDATLVPRLADQELAGPETALATYWEGTCEVRIAGKPAGLSYLEMTGYDPRHLPRL